MQLIKTQSHVENQQSKRSMINVIILETLLICCLIGELIAVTTEILTVLWPWGFIVYDFLNNFCVITFVVCASISYFPITKRDETHAKHIQSYSQQKLESSDLK